MDRQRPSWLNGNVYHEMLLRGLLAPFLGARGVLVIKHYLCNMSSSIINSPHFLNLLTPQLLELEELFKSNGYEFRLVGGVVRDLLLDQGPKDVDIGTDCTPQDMVTLFEKSHIRYIPTGVQHGTLTVQMGSSTYEVV